jgi:hypothetical protein
MVDEVLQEEKESGCVGVYIDNILMHTLDKATNQYWVGKVLTKLQENRLFCREEKCQLEKETIEFLGMEVSLGKVMVSPTKVKAIQQEKVL